MTSFAEYVPADTADGSLVRAYLAGDEGAFEALFRRYLPDITRLVHAKTYDLTVAEDIAQETMVRALRYLHTYDPQRPFWPWLKQIALNLLSTERQRRSGEVLVEEVDRGVALFPDGSDAVVSRDAVINCLNKLPKRQSRALVMRYVEDRDSNDIAALFDLSRNALEQLILRGKTGFKKEYRAQNGAPLLGGFAALAARVRRILVGFETRFSGMTGAPIFSMGDAAMGAALTVSAVGIVAAGFAPSSQPVVSALGRSGAGASSSVAAPYAHTGEAMAANDRDVRNTADAATAYTLSGGSEVAGAASAEQASDSGSGTTPDAVQGQVEEETPKLGQKPPSAPHAPDTEPTGFQTNHSVGDPETAGANVSVDTTTDGEDGGNASTKATVYALGEDESVENDTNLGDNNLCVLPDCPLE